MGEGEDENDGDDVFDDDDDEEEEEEVDDNGEESDEQDGKQGKICLMLRKNYNYSSNDGLLFIGKEQ